MNHESPEPHELDTFYGFLSSEPQEAPNGELVNWGQYVQDLLTPLDRPCGHAAGGGECDTLCEDSDCF